MKLRKSAKSPIKPSANTSKPLVSAPEAEVVRGVDKTIVITFVSAALRILVPVMGLFLIGLLIDALRGQPAFFALIGVALGFVVAAVLLYLQVKKMDTNFTKMIFSSEEHRPGESLAKKKHRTDKHE